MHSTAAPAGALALALHEADLRSVLVRLPCGLLCSVRMSGFDDHLKRKWLSEAWHLPGPKGNDIDKSNVPNVRLAFRYETLLLELQDHLFEYLNLDLPTNIGASVAGGGRAQNPGGNPEVKVLGPSSTASQSVC